MNWNVRCCFNLKGGLLRPGLGLECHSTLLGRLHCILRPSPVFFSDEDHDPYGGRSPRFFLHSHERTHAEPGKGQCEANCNCDSAESHLSRLIPGVFVRPGCSAAGGHQQEDHSRNLQPQLMQNAPASADRGRDGAAERADGSAALCLLRGNTGHYSQLLCGCNLTHSSILTVSGATMTQSARRGQNRCGPFGHRIRGDVSGYSGADGGTRWTSNSNN